jgi:hypothetical protein
MCPAHPNLLNLITVIIFGGDRDNAVCIATSYGLDGYGDRIPVVARFLAPIQTGLGDHPTSY